MCDYGAGMPGHISETVLSAGGCHSALEVHAYICQATTQPMKAMPSCPLSFYFSLSLTLSLFFSVRLSLLCNFKDCHQMQSQMCCLTIYIDI